MAVSKTNIIIPRSFASDEHQRQAIEHVHGPMLVVAGAGTGKTTVLTQRIAHLIGERDVRPEEILALTYTENSAHEMRDRVRAELRGRNIDGLRIATFHAYCNRLLIQNGRQFSVLDDKDLWIYLRKRIRDLQLNYFVRAANVSKFLDDLLDFMRRCQDELVGPDKYAEYVGRLERGELPLPRVGKSKEVDLLPDEEVLGRCREIASVFTKIEGMLLEQNLGSFGHMMTRAYDLLLKDPVLLAGERRRARFILVDEFQDANFAQVKILHQLAGQECNIFAVGDPDQAIYRFRGASSAAFALFQSHFPKTTLLVLGKNRRSTTAILKCAYALIAKNPGSFAGSAAGVAYQRSPLLSWRDETRTARQDTKPTGMPVETVILTSKEVECADMVRVIKDRKREARCSWRDFAVLYRQHSHRDQLAIELAQQGIPFTIENMDVMDTPEVRDLFACLGAVVSTNDGAAMLRVASLSQFALDAEILRAAIKALPRDAAGSAVASVLEQVEGGTVVLERLQKARDEITAAGAKTARALEIIVGLFGLRRNSRPLTAVIDFARFWESKPLTQTGEIAEFVDYLDYFREARGAIPLPAQDSNAVHLMTAHSAKGLEWDHVFVLRANSNSFPCSYKESLVEFPRQLRDADSAAEEEGKELNDQEERRLFYVAMTRARDSLTIYAKQGTGRKDPTPPGFMRDLVKDKSLDGWLTQRAAYAFQTDLFGRPEPGAPSRMSEWLTLPPAFDLSEKLSASAVQTYETCPLQFKLGREWKIPGEVPGAMQYGAAIHRVLRIYYDSLRFGREMSEESLMEQFRWELRAAGIQDGYQHELYERQGVIQLHDFLASCHRTATPEVLHVEQWFEMTIGTTTVTGRIDRVDKIDHDCVVITDYKTGKPRSQEDADESLQLSIYALAAREKWGYQANRLVFYNLEENAPVATTRSHAQLMEARLRVDEVAKRIAEGDFDPTPGFHCTFCAYRNLCPATEKKISN